MSLPYASKLHCYIKLKIRKKKVAVNLIRCPMPSNQTIYITAFITNADKTKQKSIPEHYLYEDSGTPLLQTNKNK